MINSTLKKDYFWNTVGVFAQNVISPLLLVVITRINGIYDSGIFSFAFSISVIFLALGMWGGRTFQVSDVRKEFSTQSYLAVRVILSFIMLVCAVVFCIVNNYDLLKSAVILALVLVKVLETISDAIYATMQANNKLYRSGMSLTYKAILSILLFVTVDLLTHNLLLSAVSLIVANLFFVTLYDIPKMRIFENSNVRIKKYKAIGIEALSVMRRSLPVFAVTFLAMFSLNIPRYFLDLYHTNEIGFFGIIVMPITLISLAISFLIQPNVVHLSKLYESRQYKKFDRIVTWLILAALIVGFVATVVAYFIGIPVLNFVFGLNFDVHRFALIVVVMGASINAVVAIYMTIMVIMRRFKAPFYIFLSTNASLVVLSLFYIKEHGLVGSVILFSGINAVQAILFTIYYKLSLRKSRYEKAN